MQKDGKGAYPDQGRVLVTGANGHLGRRLIACLAATHLVRAVVRSAQARDQLAALPEAAAIEIRTLAYDDQAAMTEAAMDCEYVVHLVGIIKEAASATYVKAHEETAIDLIAALKSTQVKRIIYLSILGAHPGSPNSCLASKGNTEQLLLSGETPALILRIPMVLGEGDYASWSLQKKADASFNMVFRGSSKEQPIYAGDVVAAIVAGLHKADLDDRILELAGPESITRTDLIQRAAQSRGHKSRVLSLPLPVGMGIAFLLERLFRNPPVTRAMLGVLDHDDEIDATQVCRQLNISLTSIDRMLEFCVSGGQ